MNHDPSQDAPTAATTDAEGPAAGRVPNFDLVESIAMEAVTAPVSPARSEVADGPEGAATDGYHGDSPSLSIATDEIDPMVGRRIGPYELTARIGGGRIGTVYRATRVEDFRQDVALELIRRGRHGDAIIGRFHADVHVLAALGKHSSIAGLLDAGTTEDGQAYLVMEYVDGQRIDAYCDGRRLDIPARLRLFEKVGHAVHFAHQHAVIHGGLEPGAILVTADGTPRLIGFGIARLIPPELASTSEYASPEQVTGEPVTTASDVYALGVMLYQLLTGHRPYRVEASSTAEVLQAICEQVPERPSMAVVRRPVSRTDEPAPTPSEPPSDTPTAPAAEEIAEARGVAPARLGRILAGDLDAIVLMALRKEPGSRYASAEQFADDIHRYLEGRPVRAHRDSPVYRAAKFVRRHAKAVAAGFVLLLALVAGIVGTATGLVHVRRQRDRAEESARLARQAVDHFFARVSEDRLLNQQGLHPLRKALLRDAGRFYEEFLDRRGDDPGLRPELASARARAAKIAGEIGSPAQAISGFRQAVALWEGLVAEQPENTDYAYELARTLNDLGASLMRQDGRRDEALDAFRRAEGLLEPLIVDDSSSASRRRELSLVLQNIGQIRLEQGHPDEAVAALEKVLEIEAQRVDEDPGAIEPKIALARTHGLLGQAWMSQPDGVEAALESYQKAVEFREAVVRERPELADQAYLLAMDLGDCNVAQQMAGKLDSALKGLRRALEILERLDRQYPDVLNYRGGLASTYNMMSELYRRRNEPAEAMAFAEKARVLLDRLVAEHPKDVYSRIDLAKAHNNIGRVQQQSGEPAEALRSFQRAVDLYESLPVPELDPRSSYNLACNVALGIPLIGAPNGTQGTLNADKLSKGDRFRREKYGDRAMQLLRRTNRGGFLSREALESETDLDALRGRADFQDLIKELARSKPGAQ